MRLFAIKLCHGGQIYFEYHRIMASKKAATQRNILRNFGVTLENI